MPLIVYTTADITSANIGDQLRSLIDFEQIEPADCAKRFRCQNIIMAEIDKPTVLADNIKDYSQADFVIFAERHTSSKGVSAFTTHAAGNWSSVAPLGGKPKQLAVAAPIQMLNGLRALDRLAVNGVPASYEATHHGPILNIPCLFIEAGGNDQALHSKQYAAVVAHAIEQIIAGQNPEYDKVALGIGGTHYPNKFNKLALQGRYAFSHIMSRHYISEHDMIEQAIQRSVPRAELAVIEWKSLKTSHRHQIIRALEQQGLDHVRV